MKCAVVYLPIRCPCCEQTTDVPYTRLEIATLLLSSQPFRIYSPCHSPSWDATEEDRKALFALLKPPGRRMTPDSAHKSLDKVPGLDNFR